MNSEQFMANFNHVADAPGGVDRLRDLIYHFAFAGKLVAHSRETAENLAEVLAEKASPTGRTRRAVPEPVAGFYSIPPHWLWVSIGRVGHDWGQTRPAGDFTYIDVSAIDNQRGVVADGAAIVTAADAPSRARKCVKKGTVIYSTVRPYLLNVAIIERDFDPAPIASTAFAILHPHDGVEAKYVYYFLRSPAFVAYVESVQSGIAYPAISDQKFFAASFPLAPTEEQKRIVAKVDELMALCDQLEAQQQERERRFPVLSRTFHARFAEAPTPANLNRIFDETGSVSPADLRTTVLTLAVVGDLVEQLPTTESSSELLRRIADDWKGTASKPDLSRSRVGVKDQEVPHPVPKGWTWSRVQDLTQPQQSVTYGILKPVWVKSGVPTVRVTEMKSGTIDISALPHCSANRATKFSKTTLAEGDLLITKDGTIGKTAFVPPELAGGNITQHVLRFPISKHVDRQFVRLCIDAPPSQAWMVGETKGVALKGVNVRDFRRMPIPVPPLAEQRRIVAKVDELMALVDRLEALQQTRVKLAAAFARACVDSLTGTTQLERPKKMKAPKTELVSLVTLGKKPKPGAKAPLALLLSQHKGTLVAKSLWQQSGLTIDAFYQQLKTELAQGWIAPPAEAEMKILDEA